jgi:orotate phosphoribosyltransferase
MEIPLPLRPVTSSNSGDGTLRQKLVDLLAVRSAKQGEFKLASGRISSLYIDARMTTMSPEGLALIGPLGLQTLRDTHWDVDSIGGLTLGADPIAYSISLASSSTSAPLRAFTVRKEAKQHGTGKLIEGPFVSGDRVAVIEDVITTGGSALQAIRSLQDGGAVISGVLGLVDREEGGREAIENAGFRVVALSTATEIIRSLNAQR